MSTTFQWLNEPPRWSGDSSALSLSTAGKTDFWQTTFYGFKRDDGHAFLAPVEGDFTASAIVTGQYEELYDQAGLMLRIDPTTWIKTGIEFTDGVVHFSVVVTRGVSDWSVTPLPQMKGDDPLKVRITRHDDAVRIQYAIGDSHWQLARLTCFPAEPASVGVMACSPQREGFEASFRDIRVGPAIDRKLHAD